MDNIVRFVFREDTDGPESKRRSFSKSKSSEENEGDHKQTYDAYTFTFIGGQSPQTFPNGIMCISNERAFKCDIVEAPFKYVPLKRLKDLEGKFKISFNNESIPHVRCYRLIKSDECDVRSEIEKIQSLPFTVAILLINLSSEMALDEHFCSLFTKDFVINVPVYTTSAENGHTISDMIRTSSDNCHCQFELSKENDLVVIKTLLDHFRDYLFPKGRDPVVVSRDRLIFQLMSSALSNSELMKDNEVTSAVKELKNHLGEIYSRGDFIFLIYLITQLSKNKEIFKLKTSTKHINEIYESFMNYMITLNVVEVSQSIKNFIQRENFELMGPNGSRRFAFYELYTGIVTLLANYKRNLNISKSSLDDLCLYLTNIFKWTIAALKFSDSPHVRRHMKTLSIWKNHVISVLDEVRLTDEIFATLVNCIVYEEMFALPSEHTFIGSGCINELLQKGGNFRSLPELNKMFLHLHTQLRTNEEFLEYFCEQPLNLYQQHLKKTKDKNKKNYIAMITDDRAASSNVTELGFDYLTDIVSNTKFSSHDTIEFKLEEWITFLLSFLNLMESKNLLVIRKISNQNSELFHDHDALYAHFLQEMQNKGKELLNSITLPHFISLHHHCKGIWSIQTIINFFILQKQKFKNAKMSSNIVSALSCFSESFRGASTHGFLVDHLLIPLSEGYANSSCSMDFIVALVQLDCEYLLEIRRHQYVEDSTVVASFIHFLKKYIAKHAPSHQHNLFEYFTQITRELKSVNSFKMLIFEIIAEELSTFSVKPAIDDQWLNVLKTVVANIQSLMKNTEVSNEQYQVKFYWNIIGGICTKIPKPSVDTIHPYEVILVEIGPLNQEEYELEAAAQSIPDIQKYLSLAESLKQKLRQWKLVIESKDVTFNNLKVGVKMQRPFNEIASKFKYEDVIVDISLMEAMIQDFIEKHKALSFTLVKSIPGSNWLTLGEMLRQYHVELPKDILESINEYFFYPSEKPTNARVQNLPDFHDGLQLLYVKENLTYKQILSFISHIEKFLGSLLPLIPFLEYFNLKRSKIFGKLINEQLPGNGSKTPEDLAVALRSVKSKLENILSGEAVYKDFSPLLDKVSFVIRNEITLINNYEEFKSYQGSSAIVHFESFLILLESRNHIDSLCSFCDEFQLEKCLESKEMIRLKEIASELKNSELWQAKKLNAFTKDANEIQDLLQICSDSTVSQNRAKSFSFLELFEPLNTKTKDLRVFLNENNFRGKGQARFKQLHALVTQQLQHEEYNSEVLAKLYTVYYNLLEPLNDKNLSFQVFLKTVSGLDVQTCLAHLRTVNENLDLVRMWFCRAEGDTVANTTAELLSINLNGVYSIGVSKSNEVTLKFQPENIDEEPTTLSDTRGSTAPSTWNTMEIQDFIRRLGFLEPNEDLEKFMKLNEMVTRLQKLMKSLHDMGHFSYPDSIFPYKVKCSISIEDINIQVTKAEQDEIVCSEEFASNRKEFKWLSFLTNYDIIHIYKLMNSGRSCEEISQSIFSRLLFLIPESLHSQRSTVHLFNYALNFIKGCPTEAVGSYLKKIFQVELNPFLVPYTSTFRSYAMLHQCHNYSSLQLIQYLYTVNEKMPKPYQILQCSSMTTMADVHLFLQRVEYFPQHYYFLQIDLISSKLQEFLLQQYMELYERMLKSGNCSTIHFIETSSSILHEAPYINTITLSIKNVEIPVKDDIQLVYGLKGNGKTHYIKQQLQLTDDNIVIGINEEFSVCDIIEKLKFVKSKNPSLHFNFTLLPPGDSVAPEERRDFNILMNKIGWFMFNLFVLGYVHDNESEVVFSASSAHKWKVFIEVPSICEDPTKSLSSFQNYLPIFLYVGNKILIDSEVPYVVDDDVQLVCKYLNALKKEESQPHCGINKLFYGVPIRFGNTKDLDPSVCLSLLKNYIPENMRECKISQKLFIKYMNRRCQFLENFPGYNYNQGHGTNKADTRQLGSTLMNAMLKEVSRFCDQSTKENWSVEAHQQLIYEQQGGGSIGLITLYPDKIPLKEKEAFEKIKLEIPLMGELYKREMLDVYLARALSLPLSAVTHTVRVGVDKRGKPITETRYNKLQIIDDNNYILTLDYALKMININERKECGMPVIIEGETGVGKTELLKMLSKLWNYEWVIKWEEHKNKLDNILSNLKKKRHIKREMSLRRQLTTLEASFIEVDEESSVAAGRGQYSDLTELSDLKKTLLELRHTPLLSILKFKHESHDYLDYILNLDSSEFDTKIIFKFVRALFTAEASTFHKLDVHSGLKPSDIKSFFDEVTAQAEQIQKMFSGTANKSPQVTAYLDEINTSSCMGLFKEIVVDRSIDGKPIPENVFIIAACNPLRGDSTVMLRNVKNVWHKPTYYVRELHPTIDYLKWDYGALNDIQEREYVTAKMNILTDEVIGFTSEELIHLIVESQKKIREFAKQTLKKAGFGESEAKRCSRSCVSQRDMQRVFDFYKWIIGTYDQFQRYATIKERTIKAVLVSLGVVYYLRLGEKDKQSYAEFLDSECTDIGIPVNFTESFQHELNWYIERFDLPPGIAKTNALKENVFANIICCQTHTPLIIIGEPGTSKTLSFNLVTEVFQGRASKNNDFRDVKFFKGLQPYFYQCSQHTNSLEIQNLFSQATQRQRIYASSNVPTYCVVFMDEAGLPEERHESLKVLHYHLDNRQVSFVGITNHALDAAKTNRAISLYRPETSSEDLTILASDLLQSTITFTENKVANFCLSFSELMKNKKFKNFYGQRDFMHFLNYLKRRQSSGFLTKEIVLEALERNFNGHEDFAEVFDCFLKTMEVSYSQMYHRNILEIVEESVKDLPSKEATRNNIYIEDSGGYILIDETALDKEHNVRYKLVIDNSEDDSAVRYLFTCGVLDKHRTQMLICSDFPEESRMHISTIAKVIHSAEQGQICLLLQTEMIHESFYELFNQRFRILDDPQKGLRLFTNISIGAHTKPCRVDSQFQCIVVIKKSELKYTPQAFLSRFEKFFFSYNALYKSVIESKPPNMRTIISTMFDKVSSFVIKLQSSKSFYGYTPLIQDTDSNHIKTEDSVVPTKFLHETLHSLLLSLLPLVSYRFNIGCDITEEHIAESQNFHFKILGTALNALRSEAGWSIPYIVEEELESDCKDIFDYLLQDASFTGAVSAPYFDLKGAVGEALDAIHSATGEAPIMGEDSCLVIAAIVHWLIRHITKHLVHVLTPEALVVHEKNIPKSIVKAYFEFQEHFSLKRLIESHIKKMKVNKWHSQFCASKLLVYTRQSHLFGLIPSVFSSASVIKENTELLLKSIVTDDLDSLIIFKVLSDMSEGEIEKQIKKFMNDTGKDLFLLIANMKDITIKMVNYLRILIEQQENFSTECGKLVVILLQFPQVQFFNRCYPVLFLSGWDHFYLDSLTTDIEVPGIPKPLQNVIDIRLCFRTALGFAAAAKNDDFSLNLQPLLEDAIPVVSPRVIVGSCGAQYNTPMSVCARQMQLKKLLIKKDESGQVECTPIGEAICFLFHKYWDNKTMTKFLQNAAHFTFRNLSTLSITSYIQTRIKALFFEFVVYVLWKINEDCNLDTYFSLRDSDELFAGVIKNLFFKLPTLLSLSYACQNLITPVNKRYQFPFFGMVYQYLEEVLDGCQELVSKKISTKATKATLEKMMFEEMKSKLQKIMNNEEKHGIHKTLALIISSLSNPELWQKYLQDFIKMKYMTYGQDPNATYKAVSPVVYAYFDFQDEINPASLLAKIHVRSEVHKMDLAQTIDKLQRLQPLIVQNPQLPEQSLMQSDLMTFAINVSYRSLTGIVSLWSDENTDELRSWYLTYKDIVQIESLKNSLHSVTDRHLRLKFFKVEFVYNLIHHSESLTPESLKYAILIYNGHISRISVDDDIELAFTECISILHKLKYSNHFISCIVDTVLSFMFCSLPQSNSSKWFITQALSSGPTSLLQFVCPAQYRYHLLLMLQERNEQQYCSLDRNNILKLFSSKFRYMVGEQISSVDQRQCMKIFEYPLITPEMDTLASMYLLAVYQKICTTTDINTMKVLSIITKLEILLDKAETCKDAVNKKLLLIESEAFMQRFLQLLAFKLANSTSAQELLIGRSSQKIDAILNRGNLHDERGLTLCMNLYNEIKSTEHFVRVLLSCPQDKLTCLNMYKDMLHDYENVLFTLPLIIRNNGELEELYNKTCNLLMKIHERRSPSEALKTFVTKNCNDTITVEFSKNPFQLKKKYALRMCIWLCCYYEYYMKDITSESLVNAINAQMEDIFPEVVIRLIICFLNKDLIRKQVEQAATSLLEVSGSYKFRPARPGQRVDPIYKLFFPDDIEGEELYDKQICNGLATMVAAVLACPDQGTHLWYHLFSPCELLETHVTGFLLDSEVTSENRYENGVMLNEEGDYGRPEYLYRAENGILSLHSLYLLLWSNFGAFCLNLLIQRGSVLNSKSSIISSDYQTIRHYCKSQMISMWSHMNVNLKLNDQQLSLLVVRSMQRMIQNCSQSTQCALFVNLEKRDEYEKMWHAHIFTPSLHEVKNEFGIFSPLIPFNALIAKLRLLNSVYPYVPSLRNFNHYLQEHCSSEEMLERYKVLIHFVNRYARLKAGGILLPSLIEFYQWIITDLSHVITKKQASKLNLYQAVNLAAEKYSKALEKHYIKLFEDVAENYNNYLKVINESEACSGFKLINEKTSVLHFLPAESTDENEEQRDSIFLVIEDLVNFHNSFIKEMKALISKNKNLQKYISEQEELLVHPAAVNEYSCIIGKHKQLFEDLIRKYQTEKTFNLDKIQEETVANYIAGKLKFDDCRKLCKPFHYKLESSEDRARLEHPTELMLTLKQVDNIDDMFKVEIPEDNDFLIALEYELFSLDYEKSVEMARGLKIITEHVKQKLGEGQIIKEKIEMLTVGDVLPELVYDSLDQYTDSLKIFDFLGMSKLQASHRSRISAIPMRHLYTTLQVVVEWINDGIYDFHTLPKTMKIPLKKEDEDKLLALPKQYKQKHELLNKLKTIVEVMIHCEQYFINNIDQVKEKSIFKCMKDLSLINGDDNEIIKQFPKDLKIENYMILRVCLRKIINSLEDDMNVEDVSLKWHLNVEDLWFENKLKHLREVSRPIIYDEVLNPLTELYGFQLEGDDDSSDEDMQQLDDDTVVQNYVRNDSEPHDKDLDNGTTPGNTSDDLSSVAGQLAPKDISEYLESIQLHDYVEDFLDNEIDGDAMYDMDDDMLASLGVDTKKDRIKIKSKFKQWLRKKLHRFD